MADRIIPTMPKSSSQGMCKLSHADIIALRCHYLCQQIYLALLDRDHFRKAHVTTWPGTSCLPLLPPPPPTTSTVAPVPFQILQSYFIIHMLYIRKWIFFSWLRRSLCEYMGLTWNWLQWLSLLRGWEPPNMQENFETFRMCVNRLKMCENRKISASRGDGGGGLL